MRVFKLSLQVTTDLLKINIFSQNKNHRKPHIFVNDMEVCLSPLPRCPEAEIQRDMSMAKWRWAQCVWPKT